jgi:O-antigen/teichoic acid export membrane protein
MKVRQLAAIGSDVKNSILALLIKMLAGLSGYILFVIISQQTSSEEFGTFSLLFSITMMFGLLANFGQNTFILKEVEKARLISVELPDNIYCYSFLMTFVGIVVGGVGWILVLEYFKLFSLPLFAAGLGLIAAYALSQTTLGVLRVNERTLYAIFTRDFLWRVIAIISILCIPLLNLQKVVLTAQDFILILASTLSFVVALHLIKLKDIVKALLQNLTKQSSQVRIEKSWVSTSMGLSLIAFISSSDSYLFNIVSSNFISKSELGALFASIKTIELISVFLMAVTLVMSKDFSALVAKSDTTKLQRKCNVAIFLQSIPVILCCIIIIGFSEQILTIFDESFAQYSGLLNLMAIGMLINSITGSTVLLMQLADLHWKHIFYQGLAILIGCSLIPLFVDTWGFIGVGYAYITSKVIWNVSALYCIRKKLGIDPSIFALIFNTNTQSKYLKQDLLSNLPQGK